jgi:site-specific DNA recombinase
MRRAAIYARFSTELQNDKSVEDQFRLCEEYAGRNEIEVADRYSDRARSGTTIIGRDGLLSLLHDAKAGQWSCIVVESLDRISRDTEDLAGIFKRLTFAGIDIIAVHEGIADAMQIGIRSLVSTMFLKDLREKTRRGLAGVISDGRHAGGRAYGYRPVLGKNGVLEIYEPEAEIVRRIFREYLAGDVPRVIAGRLNSDGIPAPRGANWVASTINGNKARGHGIIQNPLYAGHIVWNKSRMVRNPDTGKRVIRMNPESEWRRAEAPHLALFTEAVWQAAQSAKEGRSSAHPAGERRMKRLLSGLLKCGCCGGGLSMHDKRAGAIRVKCSTFKESGSCANSRSYRLDLIERAVIDGLLERMRNPASITAYIDSMQAERRNEAKTRAAAERAVARARASIDTMSRSLIHGRIDEGFFDREIIGLRRELAEAEARFSMAPAAQVVTLHPAAIAQMERTLTLLAKHLPDIDPEQDQDMFTAIRSLIDRVIVHDREDGRVDCEVVGHLTALIASDAGDNWGGTVVARGGFEPPTLRL